MRLEDKNAMTDAKQSSSDVEVSQLLAFDFHLLRKASQQNSGKVRNRNSKQKA